MHRHTVLVVAFVHVWLRLRAEPDIDPEILLLSPDIIVQLPRQLSSHVGHVLANPKLDEEFDVIFTPRGTCWLQVGATLRLAWVANAA